MKENHPAKQFKFCPFCGEKTFVWNGIKCFICSSCKRKFYINMSAACVAVIFNENGELLLTRRKNDPAKNTFDMPGGFVDLGETVENAVVREVKEELGIEVSNLEYFGTFPNAYIFNGIIYFTEDAVFICKIANLRKAKANDDVSAFTFKNLSDIDLDEIGLDSIKNVVAKLKEKFK